MIWKDVETLLVDCTGRSPLSRSYTRYRRLYQGYIHLLTGDMKDFGHHMNNPNKSEGILIQTVAEFLDQELENPQR